MTDSKQVQVDDNPEYQAFVDKFKPKKTTDDCYTPPIVYDAVAAWVENEYGLSRINFVRPFYPGGDFEHFSYPENCVVVDNPPFSILARIVTFFQENGIQFFLFAPTLTLLTRRRDICHIPIGVQITYDNGAQVNTSFLTNLEPDGLILRTSPSLYEAIEKANTENLAVTVKHVPKYVFPDAVLTAAAAYKFSKYGVEFKLASCDCVRISGLDDMKQKGKDSGIFGGAYLLSARSAAERQAAERQAAERQAAERWQLSPRELQIIASMGL